MNSDMSRLVAPHVSNQIRYISRYIPIYHRIGCSKTGQDVQKQEKDVRKQEKDVRKQERTFENRKGCSKTGKGHSKKGKGHSETGKDILKH